MRGPGLTLFPATIESIVDETPLLRSLRLRVTPEVAASYTEAGQFVDVRLPGESAGGFFAIANAPGGSTLELLIKRGEGLPDELAALPVGARVVITCAMGQGFPLRASRGRNLLLFATGSGIAPIRAALQVVAGDRAAWGEVSLFFGVRTRDEFPYAEELERWGEQGIRVHQVVSQRTGNEPAHVGYVQERFRAELPSVENAVAFLCGLQGMIEGATAALLEAGMPPERIHQNL